MADDNAQDQDEGGGSAKWKTLGGLADVLKVGEEFGGLSMGMGFAEAGWDAVHGTGNPLCDLQESIPLIGFLSVISGCDFPTPPPAYEQDMSPEEKARQQSIDPGADERIQAARDEAKQRCVQR